MSFEKAMFQSISLLGGCLKVIKTILTYKFLECHYELHSDLVVTAKTERL